MYSVVLMFYDIWVAHSANGRRMVRSPPFVEDPLVTGAHRSRPANRSALLLEWPGQLRCKALCRWSMHAQARAWRVCLLRM